MIKFLSKKKPESECKIQRRTTGRCEWGGSDGGNDLKRNQLHLAAGFTMSQAIHNVIIVASFALSVTCVASVPANLKSTLKIVNSTTIRELKHNFSAEDKSGSVAYVYPVGSEESAQSSWPVAASLPKTEAERMAVPKTFSSQLKDRKPAVNPTLKPGQENAVTPRSSDPTIGKLEGKEVPSTTAEPETTQSEGENNKTTSQEATTSAPSLSSTQSNQTTASDNEKPDCVTRVVSSDDEMKQVLVVYNSTRQEAEALGYEVFDTICKGDYDWDKVISAGALASLCCGSG